MDRSIPAILASITVLPAAVVAVLALRQRRLARGMTPPAATRMALLEAAMIVTTLPWVLLILTPMGLPGHVYLIPLLDLYNQIFEHDLDWAAMQIGGNLLVFAGFGFLAPLRWRVGVGWVLLTAALGSTTVESLQYLLDIGRVASVDDVLVNAVGAGLAALCSRRWWAVGPALITRSA